MEKLKIITSKERQNLLIVQGLYKNRMIRPNEAGHVETWDEVTQTWNECHTFENENGYVRAVVIPGIDVYEHHAVYIAKYGEIPVEIDHKDTDKSNNKVENLEEVTRGENLRRRKPFKVLVLVVEDFDDLLEAIKSGSLIKDAVREMASKYDCCTQTIRNHAKRLGVSWRRVPTAA